MSNFIIDPANSVSNDQIKANLKAFLASKPDAAVWQGFFDSQTGQTVVELVAGLAAFVQFGAIVSRREAYGQYAKNRSSLIGYGQSMGYSAFRGRNAVLKLTVVPNITGILTKYSIVGSIKDQDLILLEDTIVNAGTPIDLNVVMGLLATEDFTILTASPQAFRFRSPLVSDDIRVKLNGAEVASSEQILDLLQGKFVHLSNTLDSVDVYYINADTFPVQYTTNDILTVEYVQRKQLDFLASDVVFNDGLLVSSIVVSAYQDIEDNETIRVNAPLFNETQFVIRGRLDYNKVFKQLDTTILDTKHRDLSAAVIELFYVRNDASLFLASEKAAFVARLESFRSHGLQPPTIGDPDIVFLELNVKVNLLVSGGNPVVDVAAIMSKGQLILKDALSFEDMEHTIDQLDYVKISRITRRTTAWVHDHRYVRGTHVTPLVANGFIYENLGRVYKSGPTQPAFDPMNCVQDNDLSWCKCGVIDACNTADYWLANHVYKLGDSVKKNPSDGNIYCVTDLLNLSGSSAEVQQLTFPTVPTSGSLRLEFGLENTPDLGFNVNAAGIQTALNALAALSAVVVTGDFNTGFLINFTGADANKPQPTITLADPGQNEIDCLTFSLTPNVGNYQLAYNGQNTGNIPWNATLPQIKTALEALSTIGAGNIDVTAGLGPVFADLQFKGVLGLQPLAQHITVFSNTLFAATNVICTPSRTTAGVLPNAGTNEVQRIIFSLVPDAGQWALNFNGNQTSPNFAFNANAAAIQSALQALPSIGVGNVTVTGGYTNGFTVTFIGALAAANQPAITVPVATVTNVGNQVNVTVQTITDGAGPFVGTDEVQRLDFNFPPDSGAFQLMFGVFATPSIPFGANAAAVQAALDTIAGLDVLVTGNFTAGYVIEFQNASGHQPQALLVVTNNTLAAGSAPVVITVPVCQTGRLPANNLKTGITACPVTVNVLVASTNPEPDWASAVGITGICP